MVVLVAARADYSVRLAEHKRMQALLRANTISLPTPNESALRRAIEEPAIVAGVRFADRVVEAIVKDVEGHPAPLPLLEYALTLLWQNQVGHVISMESYERIGGVEHALAMEAEAAYTELDDSEQEAARRIFVQLVNVSREIKGTRRLVTKRDLMKGDWPVVEKLSYRMLITVAVDADNAETAQLTHESLIDAWPRLKEWVDSTSEQVWAFDRRADRLIRKYILASVGTAAIPFADIAAAAFVYASMGQKIGRVYGVDVDRGARKRIAIAMASGVGAVAVTWLAAFNAFKAAPGFGFALSFALEAPLLSAITYAAGSAWKYYFRIRYLGGGAPTPDEVRRLLEDDVKNRLGKIRRRSRN